MSYSQHAGEEEAILQLLGSTEGKALDVGAWVATTFSNTRALYERGWHLVLVEPSPGPFLLLMRACSHCGHGRTDQWIPNKNEKPCDCKQSPNDRYESYGEDPRVTLIHAAVSSKPDILQFYASDDAVSTTERRLYTSWGRSGGFYGRFYTPSVTVEELWKRFGPFNFVNIDTEGMNKQILFSLPLDRIHPYVICVEYSPQEKQESVDYLKRFGYVEHFVSSGNLLYKKGSV